VAERRALALGVAAAAVVATPVTLALTDRHLTNASTALVVSTSAGALAVSALAIQPLLARGRRIARHQIFGSIVLVLVLVHVAALFVESPDDARFALSPDGPTRARMALFATVALFGVVALGALRTRLPLSPAVWRVLHAYLAVVVITLGIGHAVLTDGALDDAGYDGAPEPRRTGVGRCRGRACHADAPRPKRGPAFRLGPRAGQSARRSRS
jgi:predicted ferric reductase